MPHILIPRAHLFGNPSKISAQISPDGRLLAWLAPSMACSMSESAQATRLKMRSRSPMIANGASDFINGPMTDATSSICRTRKATRIFMFTPSIRRPARQGTSLH